MDIVHMNIVHVTQCYKYLISLGKKNKLKYQVEQSIIKRRQKRRRLILIQLLEKKPRNLWVEPELLNPNHGNFWEVTVPYYTDERFHKKFRLSRASFDNLCACLSPYLRKHDTNFRKAIPVLERIAVALTVLKGNVDFWSVADLFGVGKSTVGYLLMEFCTAVIMHFNYLIHFPQTEEEKQEIANGFYQRWQFYDCFGAMDNTHIPVLPPGDQPEEYYNYKCFYSVNVLAVVDHLYRFTYVLNGAPGKCNDASIFRKSHMFELYDNSGNKVPEKTTKFHLISDAAFPLMTWVMKPFPIILEMPQIHKNYNYRLSSARMSIENGFGRLKARFRILSRRPNIHLQNMLIIIKACMILHNYCENNNGLDVPQEWIDEVVEEERLLLFEHADQVDQPILQEEEVQIEGAESITARHKRIGLAERLCNDGISIKNIV